MIIFIIIFSLCLGSFANVLIYRIPLDISIIRPGSFCPACKNKIKWYHNIPLISYFLLRGKCGYCRNEISVQYPAIETLTALAISSVFLFFASLGDTPGFLIYAVFTFILIVVAGIDFKHSIIPDIISIPLLLTGLALSPFNLSVGQTVLYRIANSISGIVAGSAILIFISYLGKICFKKEAMGEGDIKLLAAIGAFLGWKKIFLVLLLGSMAGTLYSFVLIYLLKTKKWGDYLPFGPFLAFGAFLSIFL